MEWHPFFYKGHETNIEVNKMGEVRRVPKDWMKRKPKIKLSNLYKSNGYYSTSVVVKDIGTKRVHIHQIMAVVFFQHTPCGHKFVVDHIDDNKINNKIENLRIVTNKENVIKSWKKKFPLRNYDTHKLNKGKKWAFREVKGYYKAYKYYAAKISINGIEKHLGTFNTAEEAKAAYEKARAEKYFGESAVN